MHADKIETALTEALKHLDNSTKSLTENEERSAADSLWSASSEVEYAVFVMSLVQSEAPQISPKMRIEPTKEPMEPRLALISALQLVQKSKASIQSGDFGKGYEEARTARNLIIKTRELLEKKLREKAK